MVGYHFACPGIKDLNLAVYLGFLRHIVEEHSRDLGFVARTKISRKISLHHHRLGGNCILYQSGRQEVGGIAHDLQLPGGVEVRGSEFNCHISLGIGHQIRHEESQRHLHRSRTNLIFSYSTRCRSFSLSAICLLFFDGIKCRCVHRLIFDSRLIQCHRRHLHCVKNFFRFRGGHAISGGCTRLKSTDSVSSEIPA